MATESRFKMSQERLDALKKELLFLETDKAKAVSYTHLTLPTKA